MYEDWGMNVVLYYPENNVHLRTKNKTKILKNVFLKCANFSLRNNIASQGCIWGGGGKGAPPPF